MKSLNFMPILAILMVLFFSGCDDQLSVKDLQTRTEMTDAAYTEATLTSLARGEMVLGDNIQTLGLPTANVELSKVESSCASFEKMEVWQHLPIDKIVYTDSSEHWMNGQKQPQNIINGDTLYYLRFDDLWFEKKCKGGIANGYLNEIIVRTINYKGTVYTSTKRVWTDHFVPTGRNTSGYSKFGLQLVWFVKQNLTEIFYITWPRGRQRVLSLLFVGHDTENDEPAPGDDDDVVIVENKAPDAIEARKAAIAKVMERTDVFGFPDWLEEKIDAGTIVATQ